MRTGQGLPLEHSEPRGHGGISDGTSVMARGGRFSGSKRDGSDRGLAAAMQTLVSVYDHCRCQGV